MTPDVFVEVLKSKDLKVIAVTDHNSCENVESFSKALSRADVEVIPGIEITTREEVHVLGYFKNLEDAMEVSNIVKSHLPDLKFDPGKVGYQLLVNEFGEFTGFENSPLFAATDLSIEDVVKLIRSKGGIPVLAHVDRVFGVEHQLGFMPDLDVKLVEVKKRESYERLSSRYVILTSSDAHRPDEIGSRYVILEGDDAFSSLVEGKVRNIWEF